MNNNLLPPTPVYDAEPVDEPPAESRALTIARKENEQERERLALERKRLEQWSADLYDKDRLLSQLLQNLNRRLEVAENHNYQNTVRRSFGQD